MLGNYTHVGLQIVLNMRWGGECVKGVKNDSSQPYGKQPTLAHCDSASITSRTVSPAKVSSCRNRSINVGLRRGTRACVYAHQQSDWPCTYWRSLQHLRRGSRVLVKRSWRRVTDDVPCSALRRIVHIALPPPSAHCNPACLVLCTPASFIMRMLAAGVVAGQCGRARAAKVDVCAIVTSTHGSTNCFAADIAGGNILHIISEHILHTATSAVIIFCHESLRSGSAYLHAPMRASPLIRFQILTLIAGDEIAKI